VVSTVEPTSAPTAAPTSAPTAAAELTAEPIDSSAALRSSALSPLLLAAATVGLSRRR
jgi:hypothetical protein